MTIFTMIAAEAVELQLISRSCQMILMLDLECEVNLFHFSSEKGGGKGSEERGWQSGECMRQLLVQKTFGN